MGEFLAGDEYVVDTMSRDGVHKCVCIWKYIKFPLNGAENVFYGQRLMAIDSEPHLAQMVEYVIKVITALVSSTAPCTTRSSTTARRRRGVSAAPS